MAKQQYFDIVTPLGKARYPKLDKQDVYEGKEVGYKIGVILSEADLAKVEAEVEKVTKAGGFTDRKRPKFTPIREDKDGNPYVEFKSYKLVPLFGPKGGVKLPEDTRAILGGGSIIRVRGSMTISNGGITAYMNSIQVGKLVERQSGGFDDLDDGYEDFDHGDDSDMGDINDADLDI
jgi:hypothetical protein